MGWTKEGPGDNESMVEGGETGRETQLSAEPTRKSEVWIFIDSYPEGVLPYRLQ